MDNINVNDNENKEINPGNYVGKYDAMKNNNENNTNNRNLTDNCNINNSNSIILGKIIGKATTNNFEFLVTGDARKFDFLQVMHKEYGFVLCQVIELIKDKDKTIAKCDVIGYKTKEGRIESIKTPFDIGTEVLKADDEFIKDIIDINEKVGAFIGTVYGKDIRIKLNLSKLLTKHVSVLAKSGSGKSYFVGVLLEEIIEKRVPVVIIDPHDEFKTLKYPNENEKDKLELARHGLKAKGFFENIRLFSIDNLRINEQMSTDDLLKILPKLNNNQLSLLYSAMNNVDFINFTNLIMALQAEESPAKWNLINMLEYFRNLGAFSVAPTKPQELVKPGTASIITLKGLEPQVQEIIVYKIVKELFHERKKERIPPFFLVIEEAHNFIPERSFGETKCAQILRTIASEGRKFGLGLCVISQRPARVDKNVLSQCTTQILLKITNPNDLKAVSSSVEGITKETENELQKIPIGTALVTGVVDMPLFVKIRPRMTKHGGEAVDILNGNDNINENNESCENEDVLTQIKEFENKELVPLIKPTISKKDVMLMNENVRDVKTYLVPCVLLNLSHGQMNNNTINNNNISNNNYQLLIELVEGHIIKDLDNKEFSKVPEFRSLSDSELKVVSYALTKESFNAADLMNVDISFIRADGLLKSLVNKQVLVKDGISYGLNENYKINKKSFLRQPEFVAFDYDVKVKSKINKEEIINNLSRIAKVKEVKECYVVHYEVIN